MIGEKVSSGKRKIGVIGFAFNNESPFSLVKQLLFGYVPVQNYLFTYTLSKDNLKFFFFQLCIREEVRTIMPLPCILPVLTEPLSLTVFSLHLPKQIVYLEISLHC